MSNLALFVTNQQATALRAIAEGKTVFGGAREAAYTLKSRGYLDGNLSSIAGKKPKLTPAGKALLKVLEHAAAVSK